MVRLQAENIDLKHALQKADARIEKLLQLASQAAVHDQSVISETADSDSDLIALIKRNMQKQQRATPAKSTQQPAAAAGSSGDADRVAALEAEVARLAKQLEESRRAAVQLDLRCGEYERERDSLAEALVDLKDKASKDASSMAKLVQVAEAKSASAAGAHEDKLMELGMRIEELESERDELKIAAEMNPTTQEAVDAEVSRRVEEQVFSATIDFEEKLDAMKEENEALRVAVAESRKIDAERDAAIEASKTAVNERNVALHVRDGAIQDGKALRIEVQKLMQRIADLEGKLASSGNAAVAASAQINSDRQDAERTLKEALTRAETAEKAASTAQQLAKDADARIKTIRAELQACEDDKAEGLMRITALQQQISSLQRQSESNSVVLRAVEESRAQEKEAQRKRHEAQMARLQAKYKDTNESTRALLEKARQAYEKLIAKMRAASQPADKEDLLCDLLFEYERTIAKLAEEVMSMRTVGDIRESDATVEMQRTVDEALSQIEILRMQICDLGKKPLC